MHSGFQGFRVWCRETDVQSSLTCCQIPRGSYVRDAVAAQVGSSLLREWRPGEKDQALGSLVAVRHVEWRIGPSMADETLCLRRGSRNGFVCRTRSRSLGLQVQVCEGGREGSRRREKQGKKARMPSAGLRVYPADMDVCEQEVG